MIGWMVAENSVKLFAICQTKKKNDAGINGTNGNNFDMMNLYEKWSSDIGGKGFQ